MKKYVQFSDPENTEIIAVFGCAQDKTTYPNQGEVDDTDARYQQFVNPASTSDGRLNDLDAEYQPQFAELAQAWAVATMGKNTEIATAREADLVTLKSEYDAKRSEIENG